jgi:hypothetical protein
MLDALDFPQGECSRRPRAGKGRLLLIASQYNFKRVVGVEFSHELCETARRNIAIYKNKIRTKVDFEVIETDVIDYKVKDDENVFFLFNPFDGVVLTAFLNHLEDSIHKWPRKLWLIYNHPVCSDVIESHGFLMKIGEYNYGVSTFCVYSNRERASPATLC